MPRAEDRAAGYRTAQREREAVERRRHAEHQPLLRRELMGTVPQPDRADEQQHRHPAKLAAEELVGARGEQQHREAQHDGRGEASGIRHRQDRRERRRGRRRSRVDEGRAVDERLACEPRNQNVAPLHHFIGDPECRRVLGLPRIVPERAEKRPYRAEHDETELLQRAIGPRRTQRKGLVRIGLGKCLHRLRLKAVVCRSFNGSGERKRQPKLPFYHQRQTAPVRARSRTRVTSGPQGSSTRSAGGTCRSVRRCP